jgi:aminoglycoside 3-N-acetyltransferase
MNALSKESIAAGLREIGLERGDIVLLHSSLSSLGAVDGGAGAVVKAFCEVLGDEGTLVVPVFGSLGAITDAVKSDPRATVSIHPRAAVAAIGAKAREICADHWKAATAHGVGTPYTRIAELGGYVMLLGVDHDRNTTLHSAEAILELPYLKPTSEYTFETPEGEVRKSWPFFPGPHRDFIGLDRLLLRRGIVRLGRIGDAVVRLMKSRDLIDAGRDDPGFALCRNSSCRDCVRQRADLTRARIARESFSLVASSALAGVYPEEIVESCLDAGVDSVEVDLLYGTPWHALPDEKLCRAVAAIRESGIDASVFRLAAEDYPTERLAKRAKELGASRVVVPLGAFAAEYLTEASEAGIEISFVNRAMTGAVVSKRLFELADSGHPVGLAFDAAAFVRAGEHPFLGSYRCRLKRFIERLYLADVLTDGTPTALACGNAEIAELVSILRCSNFQGTFVLAGREGSSHERGRALCEAVAELIDVLER